MDLVPLTKPGIPVFPIHGFEILGGAGRMDVNGCKWLLHTDSPCESMRLPGNVSYRSWLNLIYSCLYELFHICFYPILPTECNWVPHIQEGTSKRARTGHVNFGSCQRLVCKYSQPRRSSFASAAKSEDTQYPFQFDIHGR